MEKIIIAKIVNTHALKGELKLKLLTDYPLERFKVNQEIMIKINDQYQNFIVDSFRMHKDLGYLKLQGYTDINQVLHLKNTDIYIDKKYITSLEEGHYCFELIGFNCFDQQGNLLGKVKTFYETGAHNNIVIENKDTEFMVPYVDFFIKGVNLNQKEIIINVIEGLL